MENYLITLQFLFCYSDVIKKSGSITFSVYLIQSKRNVFLYLIILITVSVQALHFKSHSTAINLKRQMFILAQE